MRLVSLKKWLTEFYITESATLSYPRKNCSLLKMAHKGKAALNIRRFTIHSALNIVYTSKSYFIRKQICFL